MKKFRTALLSGLAILSMGLVTTGVVSGEKNVSFSVTYAVDNVASYYASITDSMEGKELLTALNSLNNSKRKRTVGYAGMRQFASKCDRDPNGSGKIVGFYDNKLIGPSWDSGKTWNREHVWPNVRGGDRVEDDAHMVRPAAVSTNSDRGSKGYGEESYDPGQYVPYYRGSASRIIFYAAIADLDLKIIDNPLNFHGAGSFPDSMGSLSDMLKWNLQYLPSDTSFTGKDDVARRTELNRNEVIQNDSNGQGNRNPFIDHPEYACRIWGKTNAETAKICGGSYVPPTPPTPGGDEINSVSLDRSELTLDAGATYQLKASTEPEYATLPELYWGSNNKNVATVSSTGLVTAVSAGTAVIRVGTPDGAHVASCTVTVTGGAASGGNGCGGNIATTSTIIATLSILGIGLILISRKRKASNENE